MQTNSAFHDDVSKLMSGFIGLAQSAGEEAKAAFRAQGDKLAAEFDLVRRDEMDAALAVLRAEIAELRAEVAQLRGGGDSLPRI